MAPCAVPAVGASPIHRTRPRDARRRSTLSTVLLAASVALTACGGNNSGTSTAPDPITPAPVASVVLSSTTGSVHVGRTLALTASARDAAGAVLGGRAISWSSSADAIAQVNANGVVTGIAPGSATITATSAGKSANAEVTVTAVPAAAVVVTPEVAIVTLGGR